MNQVLITEVATVVILFCLAAAIVAFLITYEGYLRGQSPDKKLALKTVLHTAFVGLSILAVTIIATVFVLAGLIAE